MSNEAIIEKLRSIEAALPVINNDPIKVTNTINCIFSTGNDFFTLTNSSGERIMPTATVLGVESPSHFDMEIEPGDVTHIKIKCEIDNMYLRPPFLQISNSDQYRMDNFKNFDYDNTNFKYFEFDVTQSNNIFGPVTIDLPVVFANLLDEQPPAITEPLFLWTETLVTFRIWNGRPH